MLKYTIITDKNNKKVLRTSLSGKALTTIPQFNKGTAFTTEERDAFGLTGKLPIKVETLDQQVERAYQQFKSYSKDLNRNIFLNTILNTNQVLFFRLVQTYIREMLPTLYTPIVGTAVQQFNQTFLQARGLYISYPQIDKIEAILTNRSNPDIRLIVASDGEGVLGIGDQGVGAMDIAIAKLTVYTAFAGINPLATLPIMLDVGTDNESLLRNPLYLGWRHTRIRGKDYERFMDRVVEVCHALFPKAMLHWEDFGRVSGYHVLNRYRDTTCSFNDDIQGTGVVTLAALLTAVKTTGIPLKEQKIVVYGAGTAGMGVTENLCRAMVRAGLTLEEARKQFYILDRPGLLTEHCADITEAQQPFIRSKEDVNNWPVATLKHITLEEVIQQTKPTMLIGCSTHAGAFNEQVVKSMCEGCARPIIFPLSNPNSRSEAQPADIIRWSRNAALVATGSPFPDVEYEDQMIPVSQCNNYLAFPGIGLGVLAVNARKVTDTMLAAASEALSQYTQEHTTMLLPTIDNAAAASRAVAMAVAQTAINEGLAQVEINKPLAEMIEDMVWQPEYLPYEYAETM